jgi:hypothetical protein
MSRLRKKFLNPRDWEAVYANEGREAAGLPPPGASLPMSGAPLPPSRGWFQGPLPPMGLMTTKAERQRSRRVRQILTKHGIGEYADVPLGLRI